jgi:hypothetical protein
LSWSGLWVAWRRENGENSRSWETEAIMSAETGALGTVKDPGDHCFEAGMPRVETHAKDA